MEVYVLNTNFEQIAFVDSYTSFIWTDRYYKAGDFELYMPTSREKLNIFKPDYYLWDKDSEHMMIIEDIRTNSDIEEGNNLTITGRSLESILDRRIIWNQTELTGSFQNGIKKLINDNITSSASDSSRRISNFIFSASSDSAITTLTIDEAQYDGDNLYDVICKLCEEKKVGFKVTLNSSNQFVFTLYVGADRSYSQSANPFVVFSPNFENIINSEYKENKSPSKNVVLVAGEGEGNERKKATATSGSNYTGINRREMYLASNLSTNNGEISDSVYTKQLKEKGVEELKKYKIERIFEGEVETSKIFVYKEDYYMGDILELEDEYGRQSRTRVIEFIRNQDDSGYKAYPTFEVVDD